jgi:hypothetical protein
MMYSLCDAVCRAAGQQSRVFYFIVRILRCGGIWDVKRPLRAFSARPQAVFKMPSVWRCRSESAGQGRGRIEAV